MDMIKLKIMNSVGAIKTEIVPGNTTVQEIIENPQYSNILIGNTFALDGTIITPNMLDSTLSELGYTSEADVYISAIKATNGAA